MTRWAELSTSAFARCDKKLALLPVGTLEAHGEGPLGTDVLIPRKLGEALSEKLGCLLMPTLPYGVTNSLISYPGSLSLKPSTLESTLYELATSAHATGVERLVVLNGHGGNTAPLAAGAKRAFDETGLFTAVLDWWRLSKEVDARFFPEGSGHAGMNELAAVVAAFPPALDGLEAEAKAFLHRDGVKALPSPRPTIVYEEGRVEPAAITRERAAEYFEALVETLRARIEEITAGWDALDDLR